MAAALGLLLLAGCGRVEEGQRRADDGVFEVVATTSIVADLLREIGGDRVTIVPLMGPGVDPHLYRASEGDVERMTRADIVFYGGLHLEGRMTDLFAQMDERGVPTVAVAGEIPEDQLLTPPEFEGAHDPHIWMDVTMWRQAAFVAGEALADFDTENAEFYRQRVADYAARLDELDAYVRARIAEIPEGKRVLVTAHDAFNYFGRQYGLDVRGLQGISTVAEAGTADVQDLARFIAERQIPAIFVETSVSPRSIEAVRAAVRARDYQVQIGGNLYSDALGGEGSGADTYITMIRHNVDTIVGALKGDVE